jgi:hypothetical protein
MYKFQKVQLNYNGITIDYDWMLVIESLEDLMDYHKNVMKVQIPRAWDNLIEIQKGKAHVETNLAYLIYCSTPSSNNTSLVELTTMVGDRIFDAKASGIIAHGKIYINKNGGYFPHTNDITVLDEMAVEKLIFPQYTEKDIRIQKWEGGKHYYAYVGNFEVEMFGLKKWNTEEKATQMAKLFLYKMLKEKQFEIK